MDTFFHLKEQAAAELAQSAADLPIQLTVMDIARSTAYKLVHSEGFPAMRLPGCKRLIVPKKLFLDWYVSNVPYGASALNPGDDTITSDLTGENTSGIDLAHSSGK